LVIGVEVGKFGGREFPRLSLDEAFSNLVAVEGVVHEEYCKFLVVGALVDVAVS
jgi:hypothetical protein